MTNPTTPPTAQSDKPVAFCQNCGKPLDQATVRIVGQAVFCEPCLAARLAGAPAGQPYTPVNPGYAAPFTPRSPLLPPGPPNPGFAALLGLIPGVGAMYNEQYGKGIVHLMVFAVLISLSNASSLFGLMAFGWVCYMVIEAHHTARARRDGLPLPNPFGLNEVSERLGFQTNWGSRSYTSWQAPADPAAGPGAPAQSHTPPYTPPQTPTQPPPYTPPATPWGAPTNFASDPSAAYWSAPSHANYTQTETARTTRSNGEWNAEPAPYPPVPPFPPYPGHAAPYAQVPTGTPPASDPDFAAHFPSQRNRFPAGAVWLIGLGILLLFTTTGIFSGFPSTALVGFGLVGLSVWLFIRRLTDANTGLTGFGNDFQMRGLRALRASIWVFLVGMLIILNSFHILPYHRSWPAFILVAGVMMLAERVLFTFVPPVAASAGPTPTAPPIPPYPPTPTQQPDSFFTSRDGDL